jgi:hypothetical protein
LRGQGSNDYQPRSRRPNGRELNPIANAAQKKKVSMPSLWPFVADTKKKVFVFDDG